MSEIAYLGSTKKPEHIPGTLLFDKPIDQYSEGEMDLLLTRQRLEIEKANSIKVAGPFNFQTENYDAAIATVNHCLANIDNPEVIHSIGATIIGKAKAKGKKTGAGRFLQKVAKGIKSGAKAVTKVVTAPARLIAKGAMEIYLPKAAPMFLYLFADEKLLTDKMRAKRKKSEKFKNFVVNKLGMKDKHFMAIIRNRLTKIYARSPESFLADAIKNIASNAKVSGFGKAKQRVNQQTLKGRVSTMQTVSPSRTAAPSTLRQTAPTLQPAQKQKGRFLKTAANIVTQAGGPTQLTTIASKAATGDLVGAVIAAVKWLIEKLGGKKEGVDMDVNDMPDLQADSGNAFNYDDLNQSYNNLRDEEKDYVKEVATNLITDNLNAAQAKVALKNKVPFLNDEQRNEIAYEVEEGFEPLDPVKANEIALQIKLAPQKAGDDLTEAEKRGGGTPAGVCSC